MSEMGQVETSVGDKFLWLVVMTIFEGLGDRRLIRGCIYIGSVRLTATFFALRFRLLGDLSSRCRLC